MRLVAFVVASVGACGAPAGGALPPVTPGQSPAPPAVPANAADPTTPAATAAGVAAPPVATTPPPPASASAAPRDGAPSIGAGPSESRLRLGHYSSGDGLLGFVLDRTGGGARLKMDGESETIELKVQNKSERGVDYVSGPRKRSFWLGVRSSGAASLIFAKNDIPMFRDADAASLSGGPPPPMDTLEQKKKLIPALRIGHYSSGDGSVGMVLDRTGPQPKMRLDGSREVRLLDPRGTAGENIDVAVVGSPKLGIAMRFTPRGEVFYYAGRDTLQLRRDGDADPL